MLPLAWHRLLTLLLPKSVGRTVSQPRARGSHFSASPWTSAGYRIAPKRAKRALTIYKRFGNKIRVFRSRGAVEVGGLPSSPSGRGSSNGSRYQGIGPGR